MQQKYKPTLCVIGGGAAGFFAAIRCAEQNKNIKVIVIEQSKTVLNKVKIAGGGRCNVTHACFDSKELVKFYPRGEKELLGPFHKFQPGDTFDWFESRGVTLKTEEDGRVFPTTDTSKTIIDCFIQAAKQCQIKIWNDTKITSMTQEQSGKWVLQTSNEKTLIADAVLVATGSSPMMWSTLSAWHEVIEPVSSLFTFNIQHVLLKDLQGISLNQVSVQVKEHKLRTEGPLLITHWGLSGPAILKMSAWGARLFYALNYRFEISVNWTGRPFGEVEEKLKKTSQEHPKKLLVSTPLFDIPGRLWKQLIRYAKIPDKLTYGQMDSDQLNRVKYILCDTFFKVNGKSTFKEEFVTAGGISLNEVDFRTMASKKMKGLYFAGEVLDIDALTGGFNFQAAWTTGFLAGNAIAAYLSRE